MPKGDWNKAQEASIGGRQVVDRNGNPLGFVGTAGTADRLPGLANDLAALAASNGGQILPAREGIIVSNYLQNVSNVLQAIPLPAGIVDVDLTYYNSGGNAGVMMVVADAIGSADALARMARSNTHLRIQPGETRKLRFNPLTRPAMLFVKTVSALSSGANELWVREESELLLPTIAAALSPKLWAYYSCAQGATEAFLKALNPARNLAFPAALTPAAAWANPGALTLPAVGSGPKTYPTIDKDVWNQEYSWSAGDTCIFAFRTTVTVGVNLAMIGSGYSAVPLSAGFRIRADSSGLVSGAIYANNGSIVYPAGLSGRQEINVGEHHITFALDGTAKVCRIAVDGVVEASAHDCSSVDDFPTGSGVLIGGGPTSYGTVHTGPAQSIRDLHVYLAKGQSVGTSKFAEIASRCYSTHGPLLASEWA